MTGFFIIITRFVINRTRFGLNMYFVFLNATEFIFDIAGFVLNKTGFVQNMTGLILKASWNFDGEHLRPLESKMLTPVETLVYTETTNSLSPLKSKGIFGCLSAPRQRGCVNIHGHNHEVDRQIFTSPRYGEVDR